MKISEITSENLLEMPIEIDQDPNNPTIRGHQGANTMTLKGRIILARQQLRELYEMSESDSLAVWEQIAKKSKGGVHVGLEQNLEQIRHGIEELVKARKAGGPKSRGISKDIG